MEKFIAMTMVGAFLCLGAFAGCAALKTDYAKVVTEVESVDWSAVQTYWSDFVKGLNEALPVVGALFPGNSQTIAKITAAVNDANTAVTTLATTVTQLKAGTLTQAQAVANAKTVASTITAASAQVGSAIKGGSATSAVPTQSAPAIPNGSSK